VNKKLGTFIYNCSDTKSLLGEARFLYNIKAGSKICCLELQYKHNMQFLRTGYAFSILLLKSLKFGVLKLKAHRFFLCSLSRVGLLGKIVAKNSLLCLPNFKYARFNIRKGRRPCVRGVAKNPIDHPHGGGQGKTSGGRPSVTP
jgi:large subunit ribosomal protein L2